MWAEATKRSALVPLFHAEVHDRLGERSQRHRRLLNLNEPNAPRPYWGSMGRKARVGRQIAAQTQRWDEIALQIVCPGGRPTKREIAATCREVSACGDEPRAVP